MHALGITKVAPLPGSMAMHLEKLIYWCRHPAEVTSASALETSNEVIANTKCDIEVLVCQMYPPGSIVEKIIKK